MKTGPHSFTDATGVEWNITGYSKVCGPMYADCRSLDGVALTVRPIAYLESAGLSLPEGAEPPVRKATAAERKKAERETAQLTITAPPVEGVTDANTETSGGMPAQVGAPSTDGEHERGCGCARCATPWPTHVYPETIEEALPDPPTLMQALVATNTLPPAPLTPEEAVEAWAMSDLTTTGMVEYEPGEWGFPEHE